MEFRILGPLEVVEDGRRLDFGPAKQRALLAVLLLNANRVVSSEHLIDALWEEDAPETAHKALQVYVSQLRKTLGRERLETEAPGYRLHVGDGELDRERFERLASEGKVDAALELWRGAPLAEFAYQRFAQSEIGRLDELRLACLDQRMEQDLEAGRHSSLVAELEALVREHPLRERLRAQLMLALYRSGRQAEALEVYQASRRLLSEELGLEPGQALKDLQHAILAQDPALEAAAAREVSTEAPPGSVFVGRKTELAALSKGLDQAMHGQGRLFLLVGEPGIGKSRLAEELLRRAHQRGVRALVGRSWEAGGAPAFWPWVQALRSYVQDREDEALRAELGHGAADVAQLLPELRDRFPNLPEALSDTEGARLRLFDALLELLKNAGRGRPLVLFLDDLHAADEPSLLLLRFVARELADSRLFVLAAYRDVDPSLRDPLRTTVSELVRERVTARLSLDGLAHDDVAEYIARVVSVEPDARAVAEIHSESEGNPLFVGEIVRLLGAQGQLGAPADALEIPPGIRDVIGSRAARLSKHCRRLLNLASVLGREFAIDTLQGLSAYPQETLYDVLDEAMAEGIIGDVPQEPGRLRFAHVLIRDTLYEELTPARRLQHHREAADVLERVHAAQLEEHLAEIALHLIAAGPQSMERAVEYARRAADLAATSLAFEEAARLYELALTLRIDDATRCDVLLALGDVLARAGDTPASKRRFDEAAQLAEKRALAEQLAQAALGYGGRIMWEVSRDDDHLIPLLERALATLPGEDSPLRVRLLARLAGPLRDARFPPERRRAAAGEALQIARRLNDGPTLAYALSAYSTATISPSRTREIVALATELIDVASAEKELERAAEGYLIRACLLLELGKVERAKEDVAEMARLAEKLRQPSQKLYVASLQAHLALLEGNFAGAERLIHEALDLGERAQRWNAEITYRLQLYLLRKAQGRLAEVAELYESDPAALDFRTYRIFDCVVARFFGEVGRRTEAQAKFEELAANDFALIAVDEEWLASICLLAESAASLGDKTRGRVLYDLLSPYADRVGTAYPEISLGSVSRYLGLLARLLDRSDTGESHFERALQMNARIGALPWLAHTQEDYARLLLGRGAPDDRARAEELLETAITSYRDLGMDGALARAKSVVVS